MHHNIASLVHPVLINMAKFLYFTCCFLALSCFSFAAQPFKALVAPITQPDPSSPLLAITLNQKEKLVIDIESPFSWHHCSKGFPRVSCHTLQCVAAQSYKPPFCHLQVPKIPLKNPSCTCSTSPANSITKTCASSQLTYTNVSVSSTDGHNPLARVGYSKVFMSCAPETLFKALPRGSSGIASLSKGPLSLASQFSTSKVPKKFGLCLADQGVAFFGEGPFFLLPPPGRDVTQLLGSTPLLKHPIDPLGYYIGLKGISVDGQAVKFLKRMLTFDALGNGGVKLSTTTPYTTLRSHIYRAFLALFSRLTRGIPRVPKVAPFDLCLNSTNLIATRVGFGVPQIDLELSNGGNWTIFGFNSLAQVSSDVACLAFVDGGERAEQAMVIGLHQVQQNFLHFDLVKSRLGFSSLLFFFQTTCNNFNFTSGVN